jgi:glutamate synthase (NADPH/NADH) small chain
MATENNAAQKPKTPVRMREQDPKIRAANFDEVPYGYSPDEAAAEASRCLQCKKPLCVTGCPVNVQIPQFIKFIVEGDFAAAARKIKETNALPAVCGRVCPQEEQCELKCILGRKGAAITVGNLERFAADWEREKKLIEIPQVKPANGKKVAVVGSGPAGLTCAGELVKEGFDVTIFEALHEAGGVLVYGIPEFRLPKEIVRQEISYLEKLGVKLEKNLWSAGPPRSTSSCGRRGSTPCLWGRAPACRCSLMSMERTVSASIRQTNTSRGPTLCAPFRTTRPLPSCAETGS